MVEGAKYEGGWWFPETEVHMLDMMRPGAKQHRVEKDRWTYQYHKLLMCIKNIPLDRRRICIDVGGFIGQWSYHLVDRFEFVHAFEPIPLHASCLLANMEGVKNWVLHKEGLGEQADVVTFHIPVKTTGGTHVSTPIPMCGDDGAILESEEIYMTWLDSFGFDRVDFIKIDVEGYELMVCKGAEETLLRNKPFVLVEQKGNEERYYSQKKFSAKEYLESLGMRVYDVKSGDYLMGW